MPKRVHAKSERIANKSYDNTYNNETEVDEREKREQHIRVLAQQQYQHQVQINIHINGNGNIVTIDCFFSAATTLFKWDLSLSFAQFEICFICSLHYTS